MNEFKKIKVNISLVNIVLLLLILSSTGLLIWYWIGGLSEKWAPVVGGATVASFIALFQYLVSYLDYRNNERLAVSGVVNFLTSRDDKEYYSKLISNSKSELNCLFYTCKRFCEDFCTNGGKDNLLIKKLENSPNFQVKILVQLKGELPTVEQPNFDLAQTCFAEMSAKFPNQFKVKFYSHIPTHNIFITDKDAVIGPYFNKEGRKYNHSIHFLKTAEYVTDFKEYFDAEWALGEA
jgi:hypothetical protein